MGITDWLRRNGDIVEQVLGNLDNIVVKGNAQDAFKELGKYEERYNNWLGMRNLHKKLNSYQMQEDDLNSLVKNKYSYNPGFEEDESIKSNPLYQEYQKISVPADGGTAPQDYLSYLQSTNNTDEINRLKGLGYVNEELVKPSQDEVNDHIARKLLSPEELAMYDKLKGSDFNADQHNFGLKDLVMKNKQRLISSGSLGDDLAEELVQRAGILQMPEEKQEDPLIRFDEKNNVMIGYDKQGNIKFTRKYAEEEKKPEKPNFGQYQNMSWDDILKLNPTDLRLNWGLLPTEVRNRLKTEFPDEFGDEPEKTNSGRKFRGGKPPKVKGIDMSSFDDQTIEKIKQLNILNSQYSAHQEKSTTGRYTEEAQKWNDARNTLESELAGMLGIDNDALFRLAQNVGSAETPENEKKQFKGVFPENSEESTMQYFNEYMNDLDEAYELETSGQQPKGYYDNFKKAFLKDLEKYKIYLSKEAYEFLYNRYK